MSDTLERYKIFEIIKAVIIATILAVFFLKACVLGGEGSRSDVQDVGNAVHRTYRDTITVYPKNGSFNQTYMIFGVQRDVTHLYDAVVSFMPLQTAKALFLRYPEMNKCNGEGSDLAKKELMMLNVIYDVSAPQVKNTMKAIDDAASKAINRICVQFTGTALAPPETLEGYQINIISYGGVGLLQYVYLSDAKIVSCN